MRRDQNCLCTCFSLLYELFLAILIGSGSGGTRSQVRTTTHSLRPDPSPYPCVEDFIVANLVDDLKAFILRRDTRLHPTTRRSRLEILVLIAKQLLQLG